MKKILLLFLSLFLMGCDVNQSTAKKSVEDYLNGYINLSNDVIQDLNKVVEAEALTQEQKVIYSDILKRQYSDLKYEIIEEIYNQNIAIVKVRIEVYDLYSVQKKASNYLKSNIDYFYDEKGSYDNNKYMLYKLNLMKNTDERISYDIEYNLVYENDVWVLKEISQEVLEKIHGVYDYDNKQ